MPAAQVLDIDHVSQRFGRRLVLRDVCLSVNSGEVLCLLGPSGSGKSTLLKIIAGILDPTAGHVRIRGVDQTGIPTYRRDLGFVFQSPSALFPHLNVFENVAFPFRRGGRRAADNQSWRDVVTRMLRTTSLQPHAESSIATLSGGELQRIALARALVYRPSLLLLDEPLSSLDNILKPQLLDLILRLQAEFGTSVLYVTHDEREALEIATHVAIIDDKEIQQCDSVDRVRSQPTSARVATIIGGWNILRGTYSSSPSHIHLSSLRIDCRRGAPEGSQVEFGLPLEAATLLSATAVIPTNTEVLPVTIRRRIPWQGGWKYECNVDSDDSIGVQQVQCLSSTPELSSGEKASFVFTKEALRVFSNDKPAAA